METSVKSQFINPKKFILFLLIGSIVMLFAALSSAYIVRKGEGNWLEFQLPSMFLYSSLVIVLSSLTFIQSERYFNQKNYVSFKLLLSITFVLGITFLALQFLSYKEIYEYKYPIVFGGSYSNPSGSFLYVLSGVHALHLLIGILYIAIVLLMSFSRTISDSLKLHLELSAIFWHFLGGLWLYLYLFLIINHN